jgi:hypothetical protein
MIDKPEQFILQSLRKKALSFYSDEKWDLDTGEVLCFDVFGHIN